MTKHLIVFFDDDKELSWPGDLRDYWNGSDRAKKYGECNTDLITDRAKLTPLLRRGKHTVSVLFVDMHWGESTEDGLDLIKEARSRSENLPIIALTTHDGAELATRCIKAGANDYCVKETCSLGKLASIVEEKLQILAEATARLKNMRACNPDDRAELAAELTQDELTPLSVETKREVISWLMEGMQSRLPLERRRSSIWALLNQVVVILQLIKGQSNAKDTECLAEAYYHLGQWAEAQSEYRELLEAGNTPSAWSRLASISLSIGDEAGHVDALLGQARSYNLIGRNELALGVLTDALKRHRDNAELLLAWAHACAENTEETIRAICDVLLSWEDHDGVSVDHHISGLIERFLQAGIPQGDLGQAVSTLSAKHSWPNELRASWILHLFPYMSDKASAKQAIHGFTPDESVPPDTLLDVADVCFEAGDLDKCRDVLLWANRGATGTPTEITILQRSIDRSRSIGDDAAVLLHIRRLWFLLANAGKFDEFLSIADNWLGDHPSDTLSAESAADLLRSHPDFQMRALQIYISLLSTPDIRCDVDRVRWILRKAFVIPDPSGRVSSIYEKLREEFALTAVKLDLPSDDRPLRGQTVLMIGSDVLENNKSDLDSVLGRNGARVKWLMYPKEGAKKVDKESLRNILQNASFCVLHLGMAHCVSGVIRPILAESATPHEEVLHYQGKTEILDAIERHYGKLQR